MRYSSRISNSSVRSPITWSASSGLDVQRPAGPQDAVGLGLDGPVLARPGQVELYAEPLDHDLHGRQRVPRQQRHRQPRCSDPLDRLGCPGERLRGGRGGHLVGQQPPAGVLAAGRLHRLDRLEDPILREDAQLAADRRKVQQRLHQRSVHVEDHAVVPAHRLSILPVTGRRVVRAI